MTASEVAAAYDVWAEAYTERFGDVSSLAPEDRELILRWSRARSGPVLDGGCGPGHWSRLLHDAGVRVVGLELSAEFVAIAHARSPDVPLVRASLEELPLRSASLDGLLSWYSLIHTPPARLPDVTRELRRVLRLGGSLLVGFVDGPPAEPFDHRVTRAYAWSCAALGGMLEDAGFAVQERHRRQDEGVRPHAALVATAVEAPARARDPWP